MTAVNIYHVGLVMSQVGINDNQHQAVVARIKERVKVLPEGGKIVLWTPGFAHEKPEHLWPDTCKRLGSMNHVVLEALPSLDFTVPQLFHEMREYDEVWCLPAKGQARLTRCRVSQLYFMAQEDATAARVFKWIPHWVGDDKTLKIERKMK